MSSLLRDYLLVCERRASPSDRGQWFSALPATPHPLHGWKCPAAGPENKLCTPVPALSRSHPSIASWLLNCGLLNKSAWTYGPEVAQLLHDLSAWEKAEGRNELVRFCYSERIVGLLRDRRISASVHRRAGPQAARDFARLLEEEGKVG